MNNNPEPCPECGEKASSSFCWMADEVDAPLWSDFDLAIETPFSSSFCFRIASEFVPGLSGIFNVLKNSELNKWIMKSKP